MSLKRLSYHTNRVVEFYHFTAHLKKLGGNSLQMLRYYILYCNVAAGNRRRAHKSPRLNLIRNNGIFRSMKLSDTFNTNRIRTGSLDIGAHAV